MKLECLQENLSKGLGLVGRAVATRSTLPVLSNVLLNATDGHLELSGTNLEMGIRCRVGAKVEETGVVTLPVRLLTDLVNSFPPEVVNLELDEPTQTMHATCAHFEANVKGIKADEFPLLPDPPVGEPLAEVAVDVLRQMIDQVAFAAASDESRPILTGVLVRFEVDRLTMAAADGFRLSVRHETLPKAVEKPVEVIVPAWALREAQKIFTNEKDPIRVYVTMARNQILFQGESVELVSQLIEGRFPDYTQIIPVKHATRTVLNTVAFLKAVKVAHLFARDSANTVRLNVHTGEELQPGFMALAATSAEMGNNTGQVEATVEGEPVEIAFNTKFLIDALDVMGTAQVSMETSSASLPGVMKPVGDDGLTVVLMPMNLSR